MPMSDTLSDKHFGGRVHPSELDGGPVAGDAG